MVRNGIDKPLVECECHFSLQNRPRKSDIFIFDYDLVTSEVLCVVRLHPLEPIMV